jgi:hypothetical protein
LRSLIIFLFIILFSITPSRAQEADCRLRISLLTCAPGEELYSIFGHTAIRVQDSSYNSDQVFNYGTFEFGPDFYPQFIRGKLLYSLSVEEFNDFIFTYQVESRSVVEQELQLNCQQKKYLYTALLINSREENRHYRYDFLFDNCTTRAKDMVKKQAGIQIEFKDILQGAEPSFRDLIHGYLHAGHQHWSKFGIDLLLGARLDRKVSNEEAMFLPDNLMKGFDRATLIAGQPLVSPVIPVLEMPSPLGEGFFLTPLLAFSILFILVMAASFFPGKKFTNALFYFDRIFFFLLGLAGLILVFMWLGTDHRVAKDNFNLLWALPTHIAIVFIHWSKNAWIRKYFMTVFFIAIGILAGWFFIPQKINAAVIPIILIILTRSWKILKQGKHERS